MNLDTEVSVVRHVLSRLIACPYTFETYKLVVDRSMSNLPVGPIRFTKEEGYPVCAYIPWEINGDRYTNLKEIRILFDSGDATHAVRANVALIQHDDNPIMSFNVASDKYLGHYDV